MSMPFRQSTTMASRGHHHDHQDHHDIPGDEGSSESGEEEEDEEDEESEEEDIADGEGEHMKTKREKKEERRQAKLHKKERKNQQRNEQREKIRGRKLKLYFAIVSLQKKFNGNLLTRDMLVYAPFLVVFMFFFYKGRDIEGSYWQSRNIHDLITGNEFTNYPSFPGKQPGDGPYFMKTFFDPLLPGDVHDWLESVVVPLLFDPDRPDVPGARNPRLTQSVPLGALRVRNLKVKSDSCQVNQYFYPNNLTAVPRFCYSAWSAFYEDIVDKEPYGSNGQRYVYRDDCGLDSVAGIQAEYGTYPCGGHIIEVPFRWDYSTAIDWAYNLRRGDFINATSVRLVVVEFFTYNIALQTFSSHKFFYEIAEGGAWIPQTQHRNFLIFSESAGLALEFFFLMYILYYCVRFVSDWCEHSNVTGSCGSFFFESSADQVLVSTDSGAWNLLELVNLSCFLIVFMIRWMWWIESKRIEFKLPYDTMGYPDDLNTLMNLFVFQVYFNSINTVISFLKILKYLRLNERLNILTRTLSSAQEDVIAVLVVFVLVLISFAVSGNTLFGNGVHDFKSVSQSVSSLMRTLLGDFDYLALWYENQMFAAFFFFMFNILALFIIMNFIIGVVGLHFGVVRQDQPKGSWADSIAQACSRLSRYCPCKGGARQCAEAWKDFLHDLWKLKNRPAGMTILQYLREYYIQQKEKMGAEKAKEVDIKFNYFLQLMPMAEFLQVREDNLQDNWEYLIQEWDKMNEDESKMRRVQRQKMQVEVILDSMREIFQFQKKKLQEEMRRDLQARSGAADGDEDDEALFNFDKFDSENVKMLKKKTEEVQEVLHDFANVTDNVAKKASRLTAMAQQQRGVG